MGRCRLVVFDKTIEVACAPDRALAFLASPDAALAPWTDRAEPAGRGRTRMVHRVLGWPFAWTGAVSRDGPARVSFRQVEGDFEALEGAFEVARAGAGSTVRLRLRVAMPFVLPAMVADEDVTRDLSASLDDALFHLKARLEGSATARDRPGSGVADPTVRLRRVTLPPGLPGSGPTRWARPR